MKIVKEIFGRVWALWGLLSFITTFLIIFIPSMFTYAIPGKKGQYAFILISKYWMRVWLVLIACPLRVRGLENFKEGETYVVTCNHNSLMDIPLSCPFIPGANKTIAKKSFTKVPLFGWFYAKGSVLVDRNNDNSRKQSYLAMRATLAQGMHMSIYPEGTRNKTNEPLKKFYDGAFKLAVDSKKAIIPAVLFNTKNVLPANKFFYLMPGKLEMHFLPAIDTQNVTANDLKEKVFTIMCNYYQSFQ
jgi:1-acyl-sn-glycerol-3-phosphate acyltransferase